MKFKIEKQKLQKAIGIVDGIIQNKDLRSVVSSLLIEAQQDRIVLTSTDMELTLKTFIPVIVEQIGKVALPAKKLAQTIREFRSSEILFSVDGDGVITLSDANEKAKTHIEIMGSSHDEFPGIETLPEDRYYPFPGLLVSEMFRKTSFAMAEDDSRYVFNGLFIVNEGQKVIFVATDGRRLARIEREFPNPLPFENGFILPIKTVRELGRLIDAESDVKISYDPKDQRVYFRINDIDFSSKLIDGKFPDYRQVIPNRVENQVRIDRIELEKSLKQVSVMASEPSRLVKCTFAPGALKLDAQTPDLGVASDQIDLDYSGEETIIGFNSSFIQDVLKVITTVQIDIGFSSPSSPVMLLDPEDQQFVAVIMPMKI